LKRLLAIILITISLQSSAQEVTAKERIIQFIEDTYKVSNASTIVDYVFKVSEQKNLDPLRILAIIKVESMFKQNAKSSANSHGYMQVNLTYHKSKFNSKHEVYDIEKNIDVGTDIWLACLNKSKSLISAGKCYSGGHIGWTQKVEQTTKHFRKVAERYEI